MAQGVYSGLSVSIGVGAGGSITGQLTNPSGIASGQGTASGSTATFSATTAVTSGQWILAITGTIPSGQSLPVTATVTADCSGSSTSSTTAPLNGIFGLDDTTLILVLTALVVVVVAGAAFVALRKGGQGPTIPPSSMPPPSSSGGTTVYAPGTQVVEQGTTQYYAGLELPSGQVIPVTSMSQDFGRSDFESLLPKEVSSIISRRHFQISFSPRDKQFYIEDVGSTNGTMVNGADVKGKGKVPLKGGDVVSPADVVNLKFKG